MRFHTSSNTARMTCLASVSLLAFGLGGVSSTARSQGLLGIGTYGSEATTSSPLTFSVGVDAGYDSNTNTSAIDENSSSYYGAGLGLSYTFANELTRLDIGGNFAGQYYDDSGNLDKNTFYNSRFTANASHRFSERFRITNNSLAAYEADPDYFIGVSTALRDGQYFYFYNRTAAFYKISKRWSSVTGYAIQGLAYEEQILSEREDHLTQTLSQQARYSLTPTTTLRGEYRFRVTDYDSVDYDSTSHFALAGVDHQFSETTTGTLVAGAEFRNYDRSSGSNTRPYAEGAMIHRFSDRTSIRGLARIGLEDSEIYGFSERYAYRTGITASHAITDRLRGMVGASYVFSDFEGDVYDGLTENTIAFQTDLAYRVLENIDLRLSYNYTTNDSDDPYRDYDRHRVSVGATASF